MPNHPTPHFTPRRPIRPLTDEEWFLIEPYLTRPEGRAGRPLATTPRARFDTFLRLACTGAPWREAPPEQGRPNSIARHFRRLAHAGVWTGLIKLLNHPLCPPLLKSMEYWLCRAARRAMRVLRLNGIILARQLGLLSALPMLPRYCYNPDLSQTLFDHSLKLVRAIAQGFCPPPGLLTRLGRRIQAAGGRPVWSRRLAPP